MNLDNGLASALVLTDASLVPNSAEDPGQLPMFRVALDPLSVLASLTQVLSHEPKTTGTSAVERTRLTAPEGVVNLDDL